jgi:hypothetical protein
MIKSGDIRLEKSFRQLDKAVNEKKRGTTAVIAAKTEAFIISQSTLNPTIPIIVHKRNLQKP